jgi:hypothetical protein
MALWVTWLRAVLLFYRSVGVFTVAISGLILGKGLLPALLEGKGRGSLLLLVLIKLLTQPVVWYLAESMRPHQYWFYFNLGISRTSLWAGVVVLDTLLFIGLAVGLLALFS